MFVSTEPDCSPPSCTQVSETIPGLRVSATSVGLKKTVFRSDWDLRVFLCSLFLFLCTPATAIFHSVHHVLQCLSCRIWTSSWATVSALSHFHEDKRFWLITVGLPKNRTRYQEIKDPFPGLSHFSCNWVSPFLTKSLDMWSMLACVCLKRDFMILNSSHPHQGRCFSLWMLPQTYQEVQMCFFHKSM